MRTVEQPHPSRLAPSWRQNIVEVLLFIGGSVLVLGIWQGALTIGAPAWKYLARQIGLAPVNALVTTFVAVLSWILFTWLLRRLQREPAALQRGGGRLRRELAAGAILATGISLLALAAGVTAAGTVGWRAPGMLFWTTLPWVLVHNLGVAVYEELVFRGYLPQLLSRFVRPWMAMVLSTVIWTLLHAKSASSIVFLSNIALLGGLLALARLWTGRLWMSVGIHWFWNVFLLGLLTTPIGWMEPAGLVSWSQESWAVGPDGLESGGVTLVLLALVLAAATHSHLLTKKGGAAK